MKTILQNVRFFISFVLVLLFSSFGLCSSTNHLNYIKEPFIEVGNTLVENLNFHSGPGDYFRQNHSIMFTIENNSDQWDLIFYYGGILGNNQGRRYSKPLNYWVVDVYENNEFIEKLHVKSKRYPPIAESKGKFIKIKIIPMHENWYKIILYAQREFF